MEHAPITYRGMVNRWHIDDMGHMNVRFYLDKASQAQRAYLAHIGLGQTQRTALNIKPQARDHHLRFLKECHSGASLFARTAPVEISDTGLRLCTEICRTLDGAVCATMTSETVLVDAQSNAVPLPAEAKAIAQSDLTQLPDHAAPKGLPGPKPTQTPDLATAIGRNLLETARFEAKSEQFNSDGLMDPYQLLGGLLEGIPTLFSEM
ncbi:MAG: acyl-CoA thioesterase, partial [Alphaproteobacteria bacterium]